MLRLNNLRLSGRNSNGFSKKMATIDYLIRLENGNMSNLLSDDPRIRGDIVLRKVRPHKGWGARERGPVYGVITVGDADPDDPMMQVERHACKQDLQNPDQLVKICRVSQWINIDLLPIDKLTALSGGHLEMSETEFKSRRIDRRAVMEALE